MSKVTTTLFQKNQEAVEEHISVPPESAKVGGSTPTRSEHTGPQVHSDLKEI